MSTRPVSVSHLVFGLIFLGVAALWLVGVTTDAEAPDFAAWGPAILIGAGVIGLIATLVNARRKDYPPSLSAEEFAETDRTDETDQTDQTDQTDTEILTDEEQR